ncbi:hypothetical protein ABKN59_006091 [Abortiporus biennis]
MDTLQYQSLVYHQHPGSLPAGGQSYPPSVPTSPLEISWQPSQSPPNSTSSTEQQQMYPPPLHRNCPEHAEYVSAHSSYMSRHSQSNAHGQKEFIDRDAPRGEPFESQEDSCVGPPRHTRRRASESEESHAGPSHSPDDDCSPMGYSPEGHLPRPPSPNGVAQYPEPSDRPRDGPSRNPQALFPLTPVSASSQYSPYTYYPTHSRSASGSGSGTMSVERSASPALSVASALTSVSSSTSQNISKFPYGARLSPVKPKHRKQRLYNVDRKKICVYHKENPNLKQEDIARVFGVERSTISKILKNKTKWLNVPEETPILLARQRPTKFPFLENKLEKWLKHEGRSMVLSDNVIREKAKEIAKELQWPEEKFKASSGWVENFKHRHGIRKGVWHGYGKKVADPVANGCPAHDCDDESDVPSNYDSAVHPHSYWQSPLAHSPDEDMRDGTRDSPEDHHPIPYQPNTTVISPDPDVPLPADIEPVPITIRGEDEHGQQHFVVLPKMPTCRPPIEDVDVNDAEGAIDTVMAFVDSQEEGFLSACERDALTSIKCAIFQRAGGVPYVRDAR